MRRAGDHRNESGRQRYGEGGSRASTRCLPPGRHAVEEVSKPQIEVVLGLQNRTSLRCSRSESARFATVVPLYLTESDVAALLTPADAVGVIEDCFRRLAEGDIVNAPRRRLPLEGGALADMAASDLGLGVAGGKLYAASAEGAAFVVCIFETDGPRLAGVVEADHLGRLRTGAASGVAVRHLARSAARTLGVIGCGSQAETQVACIRASLPSIERVVAYCRTADRLATFCDLVGAQAGDSHRDVGSQDVVVTVTTSRDPVLRGEWLPPGALVVAVGANHSSRRELDNTVLERASFVCCDSLEQSRIESGDLIEPVGAGVLDWLEVHELQEVVAGQVQGRQSDSDIVVFKSNGLAAWDVALAAEALRRGRERGVGREV
jgi:alanine dehydrogenase